MNVYMFSLIVQFSVLMNPSKQIEKLFDSLEPLLFNIQNKIKVFRTSCASWQRLSSLVTLAI